MKRLRTIMVTLGLVFMCSVFVASWLEYCDSAILIKMITDVNGEENNERKTEITDEGSDIYSYLLNGQQSVVSASFKLASSKVNRMIFDLKGEVPTPPPKHTLS